MSSHSKAILQIKKQREPFEKALKEIEKAIYDDETAYLEETLNFGNIIKGWEGLNSKQHNSRYSYTSIQKKVRFTNEERVLSSSSLTSPVYIDEQFHDSKKSAKIIDQKKKQRPRKKKANEEYEYDGSDEEYSGDKENEDAMSIENNS